jgi:hypothetical protein
MMSCKYLLRKQFMIKEIININKLVAKFCKDNVKVKV